MCTTKNISERKLQKKLQKMIVRNLEEDDIKICVAQEALRYHSIKDFFNDLLSHGCVSGMISSLVFYNQTEKFFDKHYLEIMEIKEELEASMGQPMKIPYELKNYLAWFGFEQTAYQMASNLGLEI